MLFLNICLMVISCKYIHVTITDNLISRKFMDTTANKNERNKLTYVSTGAGTQGC